MLKPLLPARGDWHYKLTWTALPARKMPPGSIHHRRRSNQQKHHPSLHIGCGLLCTQRNGVSPLSLTPATIKLEIQNTISVPRHSSYKLHSAEKFRTLPHKEKFAVISHSLSINKKLGVMKTPDWCHSDTKWRYWYQNDLTRYLLHSGEGRRECDTRRLCDHQTLKWSHEAQIVFRY